MIAVIAAMDKEVDAIVSIMESHEHLMKSGIDFDKGILAGKELLVMKSGVGKGNAGMATTILLEHFSIDCIVNIGTAGGLLVQQNILDAVISTQVVQHDYDTSPVDGADGIGLYFEADQDLGDMCEQALNKLVASRSGGKRRSVRCPGSAAATAERAVSGCSLCGDGSRCDCSGMRSLSYPLCRPALTFRCSTQ